MWCRQFHREAFQDEIPINDVYSSKGYNGELNENTPTLILISRHVNWSVETDLELNFVESWLDANGEASSWGWYCFFSPRLTNHGWLS